MGEFPDDAEGLVLAELDKIGLDLSRPIETTFDGYLPTSDESIINKAISAAKAAGYKVEKVFVNDNGSRTVECNKTVVLTHKFVVEEKKRLTEILSQFDGFCDGFGVLVQSAPKKQSSETPSGSDPLPGTTPKSKLGLASKIRRLFGGS